MRKIVIARHNVSLRVIIMISFIMLMLVTVGITCYISFSHWISSKDETVTKMVENMNKEIYNEIDVFIHVPENMVRLNKGLIENHIFDITNEVQRERFFTGVLQEYSNDVYSFSYGTKTGEYYGARRNEGNILEIIRNNTDTGKHSWYYSVTKDMTAGKRVIDAGLFEPRTKDWYKVAKQSQKPVFSPIYKHFIIDDLALSASAPIYDKEGELQGVLAASFTLSRIDNYLKEMVKDKNAYAVIIEKISSELVANSLDKKNFIKLEDGRVKRTTLDKLGNDAIIQAYENYKRTGNSNFKIKNKSDKLHINLEEYNKDGLGWIVITAIPASLFATDIIYNMKLTVLLTLLALIVVIVIYVRLTNEFLRPIDSLIYVTEKFSQGDLSKRVIPVRNDEIGKISKSFNKMAGTISMLVSNLETKVKERTLQLEMINSELKESKDQLQLIFDSTVEGILGIDINGDCTFCNASGLKMLGYSHQRELVGKNVHWQIHYKYKDERPIPLDECKVYTALLKGEGAHVDDEVFWRLDGTSFNVEYYSYPQYKDGQVVGAVVTFIDNTERKKDENHIKYLSYHDSLTGLYNRLFFEEQLKKLDKEKNLPISIIFGDANGLKLTNDIFGHTSGDNLLKKSGEILKKFCRKKDIIARLGGDEFAILLPNTEPKEAYKIIRRIKREFSKEQIIALKCSISMGCSTKTRLSENIEDVMKDAEDKMYKDKMLSRKVIDTNMVETIIKTLHNKTPLEKHHSIAVSEICQDIGKAMKMPEAEVKKLKKAGFLHDIGKVAIDQNILKKQGMLTKEENKKLEEHSITGFRILNVFENTIDLAEGVLNHHENWDGSGYPKGLKGEEIPRLSRIIRIAEAYHTMTNGLEKKSLNKQEALKELKTQSGILFDPNIIDIFIQMMLGNNSI